MSDEELVRRLRAVEIDDDHDLWTNSHLFAEAADAIERLAADNAILSKWHIDAEARAEAAERKVAKLREALKPFAEAASMTADGFPDHDIMPMRLGQCRDARTALQETEQ